MHIFFPLKHLFLAMGILSTLFSGDHSKKDIKKPNLLFIFPDQLRAQAMGFMKEDPVITPNIDRLAEQGILQYKHP